MLRVSSFLRYLLQKSTGGLSSSRIPARSCAKSSNLPSIRYIHSCQHLAQVRKTNADSMNEALSYKIQKSRLTQPFVDQASMDSSNVILDDLELSIFDEKLVLNLTWLRDSCHCDQCTHQYSRQRLFTAKDFRRDMFNISEIQLSSNETPVKSLLPSFGTNQRCLAVRWTDGHESVYSLDWLRHVNGLNLQSKLRIRESHQGHNFQYPEDDFYCPSQNLNVKTEHWNVQKINSLKSIPYQDLIDGFRFGDNSTFINANRISEMSRKRFDAMSSLTQQLVSFGLAKIVGVPRERDQVLKVAQSLAYVRPTGYGTVFDVVVEPSEEINLAYSSLEFDLHSDLTYRETSPGVQLLHCIRDSSEGGLSYFSDAHHSAQILRDENPSLFEVLLKFPMTFVVRDPYRDMKFRRRQPVISLDDRGNLADIYYSPFMLPPIGNKDDVKLFYLAFDRFTELLQSKRNKLISKMNPGDLFIFHNRRVLHGRSAYDATVSSRFLQGCYMDWDEIRCLHEKLHSHQPINTS